MPRFLQRDGILLLALGVLLSFVSLACQPNFKSGVTRCSTDKLCPDGLVCVGDLCYDRNATPTDGGQGGNAGSAGSAGSAGMSGAGGSGQGGSASSPGQGGGTPPDGGGPDRPAPPATCAEFAAAWCAKNAACEPVGNPFTSDADCRAGLELYCKTYLDADLPDSGWNAAAAGVCVAELQLAGCYSWYGLGASRACDPRGKRAGGAGAFSWVQCSSAAAFPGGPRGYGACGYCYKEAAAGQPCGDDAVCPVGHVCSELRRCRPVSLNGQACGPDSPCHPAFACINNVCAPRGLADAPCRSDGDCDASLGLRCHGVRKRCGKATAGNSHNGGNPDGTINVCAPGNLPLASGGCAPFGGEGSPCSLATSDGPFCRLPLVCEKGKCAPPQTAECPAVRPPEPYPAGADPWCNFDPARPVFCPARGDVGWGCWPPGTACNTVTLCAGKPESCLNGKQAFDCASKACIENQCNARPEFPTFCPATADTRASCYPAGVRCSTVTDCAGKQFACSNENTSPDCTAVDSCVPTCVPPASANACNACAARKCCASYGACQLDPMCRNKAGSNWTALSDCAAKFCAAACTPMVPLSPP